MGGTGVRFGLVFVVVAVIFRGVIASASPCVAATFYGVEIQLEREVRAQLGNELGTSVNDSAASDDCRRLIIEMRDTTVRISIVGERLGLTTLDLGEVSPMLRPRAIAISAAGLLLLSQPPQPPANNGANAAGRSAADDPVRLKTDLTRKLLAPELASAAGEKEPDTIGRIRFLLLAGARLYPKFGVGVGEILPGIGIRLGVWSIDFSLIGLWGSKSVDLGRINTAGIGFRLAVWRRVLQRKNFELRIGPAGEFVGAFGYGREGNGVTSHTVYAPVVDLLLLVGGRYPIGGRVDACFALGGGWTARYFHLQADGETVSGLAGGLAVLDVGIDFGL